MILHQLYFLSQLANKQWGTVTLPIDGLTHAVTLPIEINFALIAQVSMLSADVSDIVLCPYWAGCTTTQINICTDYEIGHNYAGNGENKVAWLLLSIQGQWGNTTIKQATVFTLPIAFNTLYAITGADVGTGADPIGLNFTGGSNVTGWAKSQGVYTTTTIWFIAVGN